MSWSEEEWSQFGDVALENAEYQKLCEYKFENDLVAIPEPVTFHEASFICDFLSGKIFSMDDDLYNSEGLYQELKTKLNLTVSLIDQHYCLSGAMSNLNSSTDLVHSCILSPQKMLVPPWTRPSIGNLDILLNILI